MDTARHTPTGEIIHALTTWTLITGNPSLREHYRARAGNLTCPGCDQMAWFLSGSRAGRAPAFSAHHADDCTLAGAPRIQEPGVVEAAAALVNEATEITLRNTPLGSAAGRHVRPAGTPDDPTAAGPTGVTHDPALGEHPARVRHLEMRGILGNLVNDPDYIQSLGDTRIDLPDRGLVPAADAFWRLDALDPSDATRMGKQLLIWGVVGTVNHKHGYVYINHAPPPNNRGAIRIPAGQITDLIEQYRGRGISESWHFKDWYVLAVGRPEANGFGVTIPSDHEHIAFYRAPQP